MPQFGRLFRGRRSSRQTYRSLLHAFSSLVALSVIVIVLAACAGVNDSGTHPDFVQTQAAGHADEGGENGEGSPSPGNEATAPAEGSPSEGEGGGEGDAANGQALATSNGCTGCHSIDGSATVGPSWKGLYGHEVKLSDGSTVTADDAYITESIHDPGAKIVDGFQNIMPPTFANMSESDVNDIIAYIKTLE
ncbi:MAG TPA: cytochrome c [Thermomicrobiales bacterium]|nr:cytochrome c [Thermomicrobiales bacterium]